VVRFWGLLLGFHLVKNLEGEGDILGEWRPMAAAAMIDARWLIFVEYGGPSLGSNLAPSKIVGRGLGRGPRWRARRAGRSFCLVLDTGAGGGENMLLLLQKESRPQNWKWPVGITLVWGNAFLL